MSRETYHISTACGRENRPAQILRALITVWIALVQVVA